MALSRTGSIFPQTLLLLAGSLLLAQLIFVAWVIALPPPRPAFVSMSEIADALAGLERADRVRRRGEMEVPSARSAPAAPVAGEDMTHDATLTRELSARLGVQPAQVRLYYRPDDRWWRPYRERPDGGSIVRRRGDPLFFDAVVAGLASGDGWRVVHTPARPLVSEWQWRSILWFFTSLLLPLPLAWLFARRLSRPIRRFADAADRIGREAGAPPVPVEGPVELRRAAQAMNGMQARIAAYVQERTDMVAAIAHDLRTPLARIAFRIEGAPLEVREPVHADIAEMTAMISAAMDYARGVAARPERVMLPLGELLAGIAGAARETGRAVTFEPGGAASVAVTGDPVALRRLFQNLVDNALKFGGDALVTMRSEAGAVVVDVADRGPGLPAGMLEKVFEPFVRNDPSRNRTTGGVGLGLTIARGVALDHGASLTLANRDGGGGLVASVRLPVEPDAAA